MSHAAAGETGAEAAVAAWQSLSILVPFYLRPGLFWYKINVKTGVRRRIYGFTGIKAADRRN